jgi:hypothetical protein
VGSQDSWAVVVGLSAAYSQAPFVKLISLASLLLRINPQEVDELLCEFDNQG